MKTWKTIALSVITTSALVTTGALTYSYLQPSQYQGDIFKNEQSTSISNVSTNNSVYDNSTTTESNNSSTTSSSDHTESIQSQVTNDPYNLLNTYIDSTHKVVEYYNGYYIVAEPVNTEYGSKSLYIVYNPETGELAPNGSDMIQEQRDWIDNYTN